MARRKSVGNLIQATRAFLDNPSKASLQAMRAMATAEEMTRRLKYGLCEHLTPVGYCVVCIKQFAVELARGIER